jgi:ribosomal protein S18 acetylase RimI-like enzyme
MLINRLAASDAHRYRDLMLEAYRQASDAFTSTAEERVGEPLSWWENRISNTNGLSESFGAFVEESMVGAVALEYSAKPKTRHSALVIGMYVKSNHRGHGIARALMQAAIAAATSRPSIQILRLTVTQGNQPAASLYESLGFVAWGIEPQAIYSSAGFKGKVYMSLLIPPAKTAA